MKALVLGQQLVFSADYSEPALTSDSALVAPILSGICGTDLEIVAGYSGFQGVLGHEFVGKVVACDNTQWLNRRVVGEINRACGACPWCLSGGSKNHCPERKALGIRGWDGAFADLLAIPVANLHVVPDNLSDRQAVFCEPLASGFSLLESLRLTGEEQVLGIGDGRLGLLLAQLVKASTANLAWCGRHPDKLAILRARDIETFLSHDLPSRKWDVVIEASGSPGGLLLAQSHLQPGGRIALKTTTSRKREFDFNALVVNEWTIVGSRCGPFEPALQALAQGLIEVEALISAVYPLRQGLEAVRRASQPGVIKVLIEHTR